MADTEKMIKDLPRGSPRRPDYERGEYKTQEESRQLCNALAAGTEKIQEGGEKYNPKWPAEKYAHYEIRRKIAQVARYYRRTVQAAVGLIFYTPPMLEDEANEVLVEDAKDIDGRGMSFEVFAKQLATSAMHGGFVGILVDMPTVPEGLELSLADEQALGLRPHWIKYDASDILSWIVELPDFEKMLTAYKAGELSAEEAKSYAKSAILRQVVLHEEGESPIDAYGATCVHRYRVLRLEDDGVHYTVWERRSTAISADPNYRPVPSQAGKTIEAVVGGEYFVQLSTGVMYQSGHVPFREIPLAVAYAGDKDADFVAEPPLLGLAQLNLDHYIITSDRRYLLRLCHAPTLTLIGYEGDVGGEKDDAGTGQKVTGPMKVGPNTVITLPIGGDAKYVSAPAGALQESQTERDELVRQMAMLGLSFLAKDRKMAQETATGRAIDDAAESATNADAARGLKDGFEQAWQYHAMYRGVEAPEVKMQTSFVSTHVDPAIAAVLWQAVASDRLDVQSWIDYIKTGELPEDIADRLGILQRVHDELRDAEVASAKDAVTRGGEPQPMGGFGGPSAGPPRVPAKKMIQLPAPKGKKAPTQ